MEIAVVILNWNGHKLLEEYLPSVVSYSGSATIYVADNASTDDSVKFIKDHYPQIKIVQNDENGGFAKGYNDALKRIQADYYILLNSDIRVTENWIEPVIQYMESQSGMVACQPKVLSLMEPEKFEHAGAAGGYLDKYYFPFCRGRVFQEIEKDEHQYDDNREIFWATGACMFIKAEMYHNAGGLDEIFFAHMEEIDLCWRLKNLGYKIGYCGESKIYHLGGGTLNYMTPKKTYLNFRNSLFMITKNYRGNLFLLLFNRLVIDGVAGVRFFFMGEWKHLNAIFSAHFDYYKKLKHFLKIRKEYKKNNAGNENNAGYYRKSIVLQKFWKKRDHFSQLDPKDFMGS
ncbi:MAG: glycosyltransferase family 2 protein [Crocinitomicaceae bacterium]|nr:glycosyltransferase family 2 protein [Crocinitomicaceae bacterium]